MNEIDGPKVCGGPANIICVCVESLVVDMFPHIIINSIAATVLQYNGLHSYILIMKEELP